MIVQGNNMVNINDVERRLSEAFRVNPMLDETKIKEENTFEYNVESFILKITTGPYKGIFNSINLDNFYKRLETFKLENLSRYANDGIVTYDTTENVGKINTYQIANDESQALNINNIFTQLLLMIATSKDNYYGFANVENLKALNDACTYMLASNLTSGAENNVYEEEYNALQKLDLTLKANGGSIDFISAYVANNGDMLKAQLLQSGITDDILTQINYINQAKKSSMSIVGLYPVVDNEINKNFAKIVYTKSVGKDIVSEYEANMLTDGIINNSTVGMTEVTVNMQNALNYLKNNVPVNNQRTQVMQRSA